MSIPVRVGRSIAIKYHWALLLTGLGCSIIFTAIHYSSPWQLMFLATIPMIYKNGQAVQTKSGAALDPYLKQMAITTLVFVFSFGTGLLLGQ
jgi:1,4-dihydroxy-2-naphthoate octaprenyltransferase